MAQFDEKVYNSYILNNDYLGLANYFSQFKIKDEEQRKQLNAQIATLKRYGGIANAILSSQIDGPAKQAIAFNMQREHGVHDTQNDYANNYYNAINSIGNIGEGLIQISAGYFDYVFDSERAYNTFLKTSGLNISEYDKNNPESTHTFKSNGKNVVRVYRTAFKDGNFFDKLNDGLNALYSPEQTVYTSFGTSYMKPANSNFETISYDEHNNELTKTRGFDINQRKAYLYAKDANDVYKQKIEMAQDKVVPSNLMVSGFLCGAQRQLVQMQMQGIDTSKQLQLIKDYYDNELSHVSLTNFDEVYMTEPGNSSQTLNFIESEDKGKYTEILRTALKEGRVTYGAGSAGGRVGTVITISTKADKDGDDPSGKFDKGVQLFVPGMFDQDARELINSDSNAKIQVELAEHQAFNHAYNLIEGGNLTNFDGDGGATYDDGIVTTRLTPEEVQYQMKRNTLLEGGIEQAKLLGQYDDNSDFPLLKEGQTELVNQLQEYAKNVYADLYNINDQNALNEALKNEQASKEVDNIFMTMMTNLGFNREGYRN